MTEHGTTAGLVRRALGSAVAKHKQALEAGFRAKLAAKDSPLDHVAPEQFEQARKEFRELPEIAGEPLPAPKQR